MEGQLMKLELKLVDKRDETNISVQTVQLRWMHTCCGVCHTRQTRDWSDAWTGPASVIYMCLHIEPQCHMWTRPGVAYSEAQSRSHARARTVCISSAADKADECCYLFDWMKTVHPLHFYFCLRKGDNPPTERRPPYEMQMRAAGLIEWRKDRGPLCRLSASFCTCCKCGGDSQMFALPKCTCALKTKALKLCLSRILYGLPYCESSTVQKCWGGTNNWPKGTYAFK